MNDNLIALAVSVLYTIAIRDDGSPDVDAIDYAREPGPFWLVFIDQVAVRPDRPLPLAYAMAMFELAVRDHPGRDHGLAPCAPEDLALAGITPRKEPT